jgi:hypothetical protein
MRILLEEMMFDRPGVVDAQPVGQLDLRQRLLEQFVLGALGPGLGQLQLVEHAEFHCRAPIAGLRQAWASDAEPSSHIGRAVPCGGIGPSAC